VISVTRGLTVGPPLVSCVLCFVIPFSFLPSTRFHLAWFVVVKVSFVFDVFLKHQPVSFSLALYGQVVQLLSRFFPIGWMALFDLDYILPISVSVSTLLQPKCTRALNRMFAVLHSSSVLAPSSMQSETTVLVFL
jgi:hypothetical protein